MTRQHAGGYLARPEPSGLADVVEVVLDKGLVIDVYARVSLVGIELLTVDARIAVASVDTYLRFAEATNRLDLWDKGGHSLPEMAAEETESAVEHVADHVVEHKVEGAVDKVGDTLGEPAERAVRATAGKVVDLAQDVAEDVAARTGSRDGRQG